MQILFKFWLGHTKKMTYEHTLSEIHKVIPEFTDDIIPLLYSGESDRNGKGIFNGDIVQGYENGLKIGRDQIIFKNGRFTLKDTPSDLIDWIYSLGVREIEVIGNIYENPELLNPPVK